MQEVWKDVVGYENYFQVSNLGRVFSKRTNRILKQTKHKTGRLTITTRLEGRGSKSIFFRVHNLVANAFLIKPDFICEINHIDGNPLNNVVTNLEWVTHSENMKHAISNNLNTQPVYKVVTEDQILFIDNNKHLSCRKIGKLIGLSYTTVSKIKKVL